MTFPGRGCYRMDPFNYDEYIAAQYELPKLESGMIAFEY